MKNLCENCHEKKTCDKVEWLEDTADALGVRKCKIIIQKCKRHGKVDK